MIQFKVEAHDQQQPASSQSKTAILALGFSLPGIKALCCRQDGQTAPAAHTLTPTLPQSRVLQFWKVSLGTDFSRSAHLLYTPAGLPFANRLNS